MLDMIVDIKNNSTSCYQDMSPQHHSHHYGAQGRNFILGLFV
jgi:hypothetical protein